MRINLWYIELACLIFRHLCSIIYLDTLRAEYNKLKCYSFIQHCLLLYNYYFVILRILIYNDVYIVKLDINKYIYMYVCIKKKNDISYKFTLILKYLVHIDFLLTFFKFTNLQLCICYLFINLIRFFVHVCCFLCIIIISNILCLTINKDV